MGEEERKKQTRYEQNFYFLPSSYSLLLFCIESTIYPRELTFSQLYQTWKIKIKKIQTGYIFLSLLIQANPTRLNDWIQPDQSS